MSHTSLVKAISTKFLFVPIVALALTDLSSATVTYLVGTCKKGLPTFTSITAALTAPSPPNVVEICPGTYHEQITITFAVTLEGLTSGSSDEVIIAPPTTGLVQNATDAYGNPVASQLWVNNASGPVNLSDLAFDASGNGISGTSTPMMINGIYYENSGGLVNHVVTRNQSGDGNGVPILSYQNGVGRPITFSVTNGSIHDFDNIGILLQSGLTSSDVTLVVTNNAIDTNNAVSGGGGIEDDGGNTLTITGNLVDSPNGPCAPSNAIIAILIGHASTGTVSGNVVLNNNTGIAVNADGVTVSANKIFNSSGQGILIGSSVATIRGNTIGFSNVGLEFQGMANSNVTSNTVNDSTIGADNLPAGINPHNSYFNVQTVTTTGTAPARH